MGATFAGLSRAALRTSPCRHLPRLAAQAPQDRRQAEVVVQEEKVRPLRRSLAAAQPAGLPRLTSPTGQVRAGPRAGQHEAGELVRHRLRAPHPRARRALQVPRAAPGRWQLRLAQRERDEEDARAGRRVQRVQQRAGARARVPSRRAAPRAGAPALSAIQPP